MAETYKKLARVRLTGNSTPDTVYQPAAGTTGHVKQIRIVNTLEDTDVVVRLYLEAYSDDSEYLYLAPQTIEGYGMNQDTGYLAVTNDVPLYAQADIADVAIVWIIGMESS